MGPSLTWKLVANDADIEAACYKAWLLRRLVATKVECYGGC